MTLYWILNNNFKKLIIIQNVLGTIYLTLQKYVLLIKIVKKTMYKNIGQETFCFQVMTYKILYQYFSFGSQKRNTSRKKLLSKTNDFKVFNLKRFFLHLAPELYAISHKLFFRITVVKDKKL